MSRIFSKVNDFIFVLMVVFIFLVIPMVSHADGANIEFGRMISPTQVQADFIFVIENVTSSNPISNVTATIDGITNEMILKDHYEDLSTGFIYRADFSLGSSSPNGQREVLVTATDINGYSSSHTYTITLNDSNNPNPNARLTADNHGNVESDQPFDVIYRLDNIVQGVYGQDISILFESNVLEFVSAESLNNDLRILGTKTTVLKTSDPEVDVHRINIIIASVGQKTDLSNGLINFHFKAKPLNHQASTSISLEKVVIADAKGSETQINGEGIPIIIAAIVDKTFLNNTIETAQSIYDAAIEGNSAGKYLVGSKSILKTAIDKVKLVSINADASQNQVDTSKTELENAITTFQNSIIVPSVTGDLNNDSKISIGDVGIVSSYCGKSTLSSDWNIVKFADLNSDGKINIDDLIMLANLILGIL